MKSFLNSTNVLFLGALLTAALTTTVTTSLATAQENADLSNFSGEGMLEECSEHMDGLVRLGVMDGRLALIRQWEVENKAAGEEGEDELDELDEQLMQGRLPPRFARDAAQRRRRDQLTRHGRIKLYFYRVLDRYSESLGGFKSRSSGTSGQQQRIIIRRTNFEAGVTNEPDSTRIRFVELSELGRSVQLFDNHSSFRILLIAANGLLDLREDKEQFRLTFIDGTAVNVYQAKSFQEFADKNPNVYRKHVMPVFEMLGINPPKSDDSEEIRLAAMERIRANVEDRMQVFGLVEQLESNSFAARDEAEVELTENYFKWQDLFQDAIESKKYDAEVSTRIKRIQADWPESAAHNFLQASGLCESAAYVARLRARAENSEGVDEAEVEALVEYQNRITERDAHSK